MCCRFACLVVILLSAFAKADQYDDLRLKWRDIIVGSGYDTGDPNVIARLNSIANTANSNWSGMENSPTRTFLWSDLASTTISSHVSGSYSRLRAMALAYVTPGCSLQGNATLLADIVSGLDWLYANRYGATTSQYDNWWDWEIGTPLQLTDLCVLLYDQLTTTQRSNYMNAVNFQVPTPDMTQANKVWKARVVGVRGCVVKSGAKLALCRDAFSDVFPYVTSGDGYYTDGSFVQHDIHPYTAGYGSSLLGNMTPVLRWLSGSTWAITDPAQANIYRWVFDSYEPIIYRGNTFDLVRGREAGRASASPASSGMMDSILQIAQFAPPAEALRMKRMIKEWALSDYTRDFFSGRGLPTLSIAQALKNDASIEPRGELIGHYTFAEMDRVIHLGAGYGFGLSMCSTRIANFESIRGENLRGWFTGDGQTILYNGDLTAFADGYYGTIDQYRMPGVTADVTHNKLPPSAASAQGQSTLSPHSWVGGATLGNFGAAGMQLKGVGVTVTGKKSWFMFDDEIVCLGTGIASTSARPIETTVENRKLRSTGDNAFNVNGVAKSNAPGWTETMTGVNWANLAGPVPGSDIGYYFPTSPTLKAVREARTGKWSDIDTDGSTTPFTRNFLRMGFEHGNNPSNANYQYVLLPGRNATRTGHYAAAPHIAVLANTTNVQAVKEATLGITAANFWTDTTQSIGGITSNKKASVLVRVDGKYVDVSVSDPTHLNTGSINLQITSDGGTLVSADAGVTVAQSTPTIVMSVNTAASAGRTFKARFYQGTPRTVKVTAAADAWVHDGAPDGNNGTATNLVLKRGGTGFNREAFLRFDVPAATGLVTGASLNLWCLSTDLPGVHGVSKVADNGWIESGTGSITWSNQPASNPTTLGTWTPAAGAWSVTDVTPAVPGSGIFSFKVAATTSTGNGWVTYASNENPTDANRPYLSLLVADAPPEVSITSPADGEAFTHAGPTTITANAVPVSGQVTAVAFYDGAVLLGTDTSAPFSLTTTLGGGTHFLTAVATDTNGLSRTSFTVRVEVAYPPSAAMAAVSTRRNVPVNVNLLPLVSDVETPSGRLRFTLGATADGSVVLLPDGHTARFTPAADYSGPANFGYTVTDVTADDRTLFHYDFQASDFTDASGRGRDGTLVVQANGTGTFTADFPAELAPQHTQSLLLTENGAAGAARVDRIIEPGDHNLITANWTIAGWFKRSAATGIDVVMHLGDTGGYGTSALTLAFYSAGNVLELRNYTDANVQDVSLSKSGVVPGAWHHFAVVRNGGTLSWYHNGILVGSSSSFTLTFDPAKSVKFGGPGSSSVLGRWLNGSLADLVLFNGALSAGEVARIGTMPVAYFGGQSASNVVDVSVPHPPTAASASYTAPRSTPVDLDLLGLAGDLDTPLTELRFSVANATNGTVTMLADGRTARFTPVAGYTGPATFAYTVFDTTRDPRLFLNYHFQSANAADSSGYGRDGTLINQGSGSATFLAESPAALVPQHTQSLRLTENGTAGAARLDRVMATGELNLQTADWTIAGWFKRSTTANLDLVLQLGNSGGYASDALTLGFYDNSSSLQLKNYAGAALDVSITKTGVGAGAWHHFSLVRNGGTLSLYVNGMIAGSDSDFILSFNPALSLKLGGTGNTGSLDRWFNGNLADVAVFNTALTAEDSARLAAHPAINLGGQSATSNVTLSITTALDHWRLTQFGTTSNTGSAADIADWDRDGISNLMEFASGTDVKLAGAQPWNSKTVGSTIEFTYSRNKTAMTELTYIVEWSATLSAPWSTAGITQTVLTDDGITQSVKATVPTGSSGKRFVRLRVTQP